MPDVVLIAAALLPIALFVAATWHHRDRRAALLFAVLALLYSMPYLLKQGTPVSLDFIAQAAPWQSLAAPGHLQKNFLLNDVPLQMLPWQEAVRQTWTGGSAPFLDRATGGGSPLWMNLQSAALFPTVLFAIAFGTFGWPLASLVTKLLGAMWGMNLLLSRHGLSPSSRVFGAVAYAFCAFNIAFAVFPHTNVTALLPLLLALLHDAAERWRGAALAAAVVTLMLFGGHPESVLHSAIIAVPYAAMLMTRAADRRRAALRFAAVGMVALLLAAPLILPFAAYLPHSQRVHEIEANRAMLAGPPLRPANLIPFVLPNYFGNPRVHNYRHPFNFNELCTQYAGLAPLILAVAAAIASPRRHLLWMVLFAVAFILAFAPGFVAGVVDRVPLLGIAANGRLRFAMALIIAVMGAHGLEMLLRGERRRTIAAAAATTVVALIVFILLSYPLFAEYGIRRLIAFTSLVPLLSAAALVVPLGARRWAVAIPALLFLDLAGAMPEYNPANGRRMFYPSTAAIEVMQRGQKPYRIAGIGRSLMPNTARFAGLEDIRVHDPTAFRPYVAYLDRAGFDRSEYFGQFHALPPREVLDFLGVRFVIASPRSAGIALPRVHSGADADVYENPTARPRFTAPAPARVAIASYERNGATIEVIAPAAAILTSSEVALPGWRLQRNGEPWPLESDGTFLRWRLPAGVSRFELTFRPPMLRASLLLAAIGAVLFGLMCKIRET